MSFNFFSEKHFQLVRLESVKSESKQKLVEIQNSIEESLEENQKLVLDNVKLELHDVSSF